MSETRPINIAIAGLGFGAEFIPIYQRHPGANMAAICATPSFSPLRSKGGFKALPPKANYC